MRIKTIFSFKMFSFPQKNTDFSTRERWASRAARFAGKLKIKN